MLLTQLCVAVNVLLANPSFSTLLAKQQENQQAGGFKPKLERNVLANLLEGGEGFVDKLFCLPAGQIALLAPLSFSLFSYMSRKSPHHIPSQVSQGSH